MSIAIKDFIGVDLIANAPAQIVISAASQVLGANVHIQCYIIQTGTLSQNRLAGTVSWDDGNQPTVYNGNGTLTVDTARSLKPGRYNVRVDATNFVVPLPQTAGITFSVQVNPVVMLPEDTRIIFGPILPKDTGFPNTQQWNFNTGSDLEILASSVKMLLLTAKGERIMQPQYGTNLRSILFELQANGIENLVQDEIVEALRIWEPRASLQFVAIDRTSDREVSVNVNLVSKLNQQNFAVTLGFTL